MPTAQDFKPDEQWTWQRTDELSHRVLMNYWRRSVEPHDQFLFLGSSGRPFSIAQVYQRGAWRQWPLVVGKSWRVEYPWTENGGQGVTTQEATVVAWEDVVVPAGTFKAFRIEYRGNWTMHDYARMNWGGDVTDTYWYAPDIKADVRQTHVVHSRSGAESWTSELTYHGPVPDAKGSSENAD